MLKKKKAALFFPNFFFFVSDFVAPGQSQGRKRGYKLNLQHLGYKPLICVLKSKRTIFLSNETGTAVQILLCCLSFCYLSGKLTAVFTASEVLSWGGVLGDCRKTPEGWHLTHHSTVNSKEIRHEMRADYGHNISMAASATRSATAAGMWDPARSSSSVTVGGSTSSHMLLPASKLSHSSVLYFSRLKVFFTAF